ncbi:MAG: twin-arginine translocase subunit TatC [Planctomycetota bacterium]|jgi:sec-independent protein translocase protein TatC
MSTDTEQSGGPTMTLGEHLDELRKRIIYAILGLVVATVIALLLGSHLVEFFRLPYVQAMEVVGKQPDLKVLHIADGLTTYLKMAFIAGMVFASPWVFYHVWQFVAAGLYDRERRAVMCAVPFSAGLFIAGSMFFMFVVAVPVFGFLIGINDWLGVETDLTFKHHVGFIARMVLVFGLAFQLPLVVLILGRIGIVSLRKLRHYRRHVIVGLLIASAVLTPPDPVSQLSLAVPLWLLYELGILLVVVFGQPKRRRAAQ